MNFAREHNLKVAIKASGHDLLGRSTAKGSLLLWTQYFQDITFHQSYIVGDKEMGNAVTIGSGVALRTLYEATKAREMIFVGGTAQEVAVAGGYLQGGGHSILSPKYGLAADNVIGTHCLHLLHFFMTHIRAALQNSMSYLPTVSWLL